MVTPGVAIAVEHQKITRPLTGEAYNTGPAAGRGRFRPLEEEPGDPPPFPLLRSRVPSPLRAFFPGLRTVTREKGTMNETLTRIVLAWSLFTFLSGSATGFVSLLAYRFLFGVGGPGPMRATPAHTRPEADCPR
jgi:hypothetical protein